MSDEVSSSTDVVSRKRRRHDEGGKALEDIAVHGASEGDGSAPGGSVWQTTDYIALSMVVYRTAIKLRNFVNIRGLTPTEMIVIPWNVMRFYCEYNTGTYGLSGNVHHKNYSMLLACKAHRPTKVGYTLSNLILTSDELVSTGGTLGTTTTFNTSPYMIHSIDDQQCLSKVYPKTDTVWPVSSMRELDYVASTVSGDNAIIPSTIFNKNRYWKQGDDALHFSHDLDLGFWFGSDYGNAYVPQNNDSMNAVGTIPTSKHINVRGVNNRGMAGHYLSFPPIRTNDGQFKLNAQFTLETEIEFEFRLWEQGVQGINSVHTNLNPANDSLWIQSYGSLVSITESKINNIQFGPTCPRVDARNKGGKMSMLFDHH
ncbi:capsid protein [Penaeus monodon metallodensovirus]|uniref:capsid protein n=1 Tax=Penaeus monodon metallodensovirus TaxID=2672571 RepID=UPI00144A4C99|nr:capsid protein [Penaeus monodon metallodensovirus]6WH3_1 Chain 1, Penaeus monodon metallodensovirus major capsid protein [Penaeus monodon metallodensovirus]6WH3_2 Chain 2, Penaeus monodon metallodensovirus major capsid protein [Penaeus monodon metallodensovirus]6WH3_3 Chain 3, Penaeus monodon metallodensovirus major capsid protein [Penaeus monodon metallodensovirus]6WH3_4 Chain 4, Penaeus monodon metallodensovirus major capsid protein [Penaeus monodon metallodensovirus]6WH3_5 Chain 5, Penae